MKKQFNTFSFNKKKKIFIFFLIIILLFFYFNLECLISYAKEGQAASFYFYNDDLMQNSAYTAYDFAKSYHRAFLYRSRFNKIIDLLCLKAEKLKWDSIISINASFILYCITPHALPFFVGFYFLYWCEEYYRFEQELGKLISLLEKFKSQQNLSLDGLDELDAFLKEVENNENNNHN